MEKKKEKSNSHREEGEEGEKGEGVGEEGEEERDEEGGGSQKPTQQSEKRNEKWSFVSFGVKIAEVSKITHRRPEDRNHNRNKNGSRVKGKRKAAAASAGLGWPERKRDPQPKRKQLQAGGRQAAGAGAEWGPWWREARSTLTQAPLGLGRSPVVGRVRGHSGAGGPCPEWPWGAGATLLSWSPPARSGGHSCHTHLPVCHVLGALTR